MKDGFEIDVKGRNVPWDVSRVVGSSWGNKFYRRSVWTHISSPCIRNCLSFPWQFDTCWIITGLRSPSNCPNNKTLSGRNFRYYIVSRFNIFILHYIILYHNRWNTFNATENSRFHAANVLENFRKSTSKMLPISAGSLIRMLPAIC